MDCEIGVGWIECWGGIVVFFLFWFLLGFDGMGFEVFCKCVVVYVGNLLKNV